VLVVAVLFPSLYLMLAALALAAAVVLTLVVVEPEGT
jgi:hypothetical protein